jgi:nicotinamide-nucleotide amidase
MNLAEQVIIKAKSKHIMITTAESCTGGLISAALTSISGSSEVFERGFVTYSNLAKHQMLGVSNDLLGAFGAVSKHVAIAMAEGALNHSQAHLSVSVTGIAGPTGGTPEKPVGLVHIASRFMKQPAIHEEHHFSGDRDAVRQASVNAALALLLKQLT